MAISSVSYLREDNVGVITLYNDAVWATSAWSIQAYFDAMYTRYDLYAVTKSGVGVLSNGGRTLTVYIPQPPKYLTLSVGSFAKRYSFVDGGIKTRRELVYVPSLSVTSGSTVQTGKSAFVVFNADPDDDLIDETYRAVLARGKKVMGYCLGQRFVRVRPASGNQRYGFGGILMPRVIWLNDWVGDRPLAGPMDFYLPLGGEIMRTAVDWNGTAFTGPTSSRFVVAPGDIFELERETTYFFL